jgi:hypothetical protein
MNRAGGGERRITRIRRQQGEGERGGVIERIKALKDCPLAGMLALKPAD